MSCEIRVAGGLILNVLRTSPRDGSFLPEERMKVTSKGQVTIPRAIRQKLGLLPDTEVEWEIRGDAALIRRVPRPQEARARTRESPDWSRNRHAEDG